MNLQIKVDLKYIIQELLIVVIGIMIAFSINKCAQNIRETQSLSSNLESLHNELGQDLVSMDTLIKIHTEKIDQLRKLKSKLSDDSTGTTDIAPLILSLIESPTFYPQASTYKSMTSSNEIALISDLEFKKSLINLYENVYERLVYNGQIYDEIQISKFNENILNAFDFDSKIITNRSVLETDSFLNTLSYLTVVSNAYVQLLENPQRENVILANTIGQREKI